MMKGREGSARLLFSPRLDPFLINQLTILLFTLFLRLFLFSSHVNISAMQLWFLFSLVRKRKSGPRLLFSLSPTEKVRK